jgi:UDP-N-acetylglucosamine:LPS N-acetylglucosamine transferase
MIPISKEISRDQESNAMSYVRSGSAILIRQKNLSSSVLVHEINELFSDFKKMKKMIDSTKTFSKQDADKKIALLLLDIMLEHEI